MAVIIDIANDRLYTDWGIVSKNEIFSLGAFQLNDPQSAYINLSLGCSAVPDSCSYENKVLASTSSTDERYNDKSSFLQGRTGSGATVFKIQKDSVDVATITNNTYGVFLENGSLPNSDYAGFIIDWRTVLSAFGEGCYTIKATWDNLGTSIDNISQCFKLYNYSSSKAQGTVKFRWVQNGENNNSYFSFKDFAWTQYLRVDGFFGFNQPKYIETNILRSDRTLEQVQDQIENEYTFESHLVPNYIKLQFTKDIALANEIFVTDYNYYNEDQRVLNKAVRLIEFGDFQYYPKSRNLSFEMKMGDRRNNNIKRKNF